ncbi:MAG: hypothetical protein IJF49_08410 [Clostridia bacterium]|nr:hypothetical protein [Clostridia bacterium]
MAEKEYIERGALAEEIDSLSVIVTGIRCGKGYLKEIVGHYKNSIDRIINEQPAADVVEVKHGKWNYNPDGMDWGLGAWECSLCGCANHNLPMEENIKPLRWAGSNYCPNCGAKMDGGNDG